MSVTCRDSDTLHVVDSLSVVLPMKSACLVLAPRVHISSVVRGANGITKTRMDRPRPHGFANCDPSQKRRIDNNGLRSRPREGGRTGLPGRRTRDKPGG